MQFISILSIAALALIVVVIYSVRLERRAIATQERLALEHHERERCLDVDNVGRRARASRTCSATIAT